MKAHPIGVDLPSQLRSLFEVQRLDIEAITTSATLESIRAERARVMSELEKVRAAHREKSRFVEAARVAGNSARRELAELGEGKGAGRESRQERLVRLRLRQIDEERLAALRAIASLELQQGVLEKRSATLQERCGTPVDDAESRIARLDGHRRKFAARVAPTLLAHYEKVRSARAGVGIVRLSGDECGGCNMSLPPQEAHRIRSSSRLSSCPNCLRILLVGAD